jgi:hypothetical protein
MVDDGFGPKLAPPEEVDDRQEGASSPAYTVSDVLLIVRLRTADTMHSER